VELIITEKPSSAKKIAEAIADGKPKQQKANGVSWYELRSDGHEVVVVGAVGHLYTVAEKNKKGWTYPVFETQWVPSYEADKGSAHTKKYLAVIKRLAKKATQVTIATDFDIEGEVIGYNILRFAANKEDGERMKYSTVTTEDLKRSYANKMKSLEWGQAMAGVTRHELDWYYGINLSRALTLAVKRAGRFKILSSGRVQGPALKLLADKEREIKAFVPEPFWQVELHTKELSALHEKDKFTDQKEAQKAHAAVTKEAVVTAVNAQQRQQAPPNPFDLTSLQTEAYRSFRMNPKETLQHAQDLYSAGYISYPRTSSQKLPKEIGYEKVLSHLAKQKAYSELAKELLSLGELKPNEGSKSDPAHPAIYPTGVAPSKMRDRAKNVYDIIVRRFMATFASPATRETVQVHLDSGGETFITKGTRTIEPGWHQYYGPHVKQQEQELPKMQQGQSLPVENVELHEKETQPPKRYTPSSIIKELEKQGLGTKATRADIIENLFNRGYVHEQSIQVSEIGLSTVDTLERYVPEILDAKLTREIEEEMEEIREKKTKPQEVLSHAQEHLTQLLNRFKEHEESIGKELLEADQETRDSQTVIGPCQWCGHGELQIRRGKYGLFVGCTNYPECENTYNLPKSALAKPAGTECAQCLHPLVKIKQGRRGWRDVCVNPECPSKDLTEEAVKRKHAVEETKEACPKCGKELLVRTSAYGSFVGCSGYPKCRHTEALKTKGEAAESP
jgi:DNA topoisomerase I